MYSGEFRDSKFHGTGTYKWENGSVYTGSWAHGKRNGKGQCKFADCGIGSSYDGEWAEDSMHGKGVYTIDKERTFKGNFEQGYPTTGSLTFRKGSKQQEKFDGVVFDGKTFVGGNPIWFWSPPLQPRGPSAPCGKSQQTLPDPQQRLLQLSDQSKEFQVIRDLFLETGPAKCTILKIERVQNPHLRAMHDTRRAMIYQKYAAEDTSSLRLERWLFHSPGVSSTGGCDALSFIIEQGFVPLLSGSVHGEKFGMGTYFAATSGYASKYAKFDPKTGCRRTIVARVVVGKYTQGHETMRQPPPLPGHPGQRFDSLVNTTWGPEIFVIQDSVSACPAYVISYL